MRRTKRYKTEGANSLWNIYQTVSFWKTFKNTVIIEIGRFTPFMRLKNSLYRTFLGMKIGDQTALAYKVVPDIMFPELISIGRNTIIGYNTVILAHEYLIEEYRLGEVIIGNHVMIGANSTVLPGVTIGDGAVISAATLVHRDVPPGAFAGGNPMQIKEKPQPELSNKSLK
ncbi:acyltransferase [Pseudobacillus badius]|uniref:acyltransferase n=1 Tax=Bacillus badius TaxID=1455 RepID=UPI0007B04B97|nr:acyltransferase [Bacillus badius]KZO00242.1 acetyltransferase [Bacillus badius]MED0668284.1 acyltransferase [Bacillus badius]OCS86406.1 acetyltransferase [Bacillus badius]OVE52130.1 acetyltransferase [Bacillus badius]TDW03836.1 acetyltransferase-like isoleucine patch superfamily enzyme [Bacillus badius]